ncbi:ANTAR domain-containing protein [Streptomyces albidus (ex Kaewkla and Franco 2022)]|uniref:ANTAR domain-containing protein n=1 Tax=Streptomyces albidus (ex Kaewkla and Franco 2022) TaxID=722709 RepID=UPI0015EF77EA|nr:ANTAR domain-containing protein [Streptomyces albidus (ex Kaewkla and Franco 2022)]
MSTEEARTELEQLRRALSENETIGQAQGVLMAVYACDAEQARRILVKVSQNTNTKLQAVAEQVVATGHNGPVAPAFTRALRAAVLSLQSS